MPGFFQPSVLPGAQPFESTCDSPSRSQESASSRRAPLIYHHHCRCFSFDFVGSAGKSARSSRRTPVRCPLSSSSRWCGGVINVAVTRQLVIAGGGRRRHPCAAPPAMIKNCNDVIDNEAGQRHWADRLADSWRLNCTWWKRAVPQRESCT